MRLVRQANDQPSQTDGEAVSADAMQEPGSNQVQGNYAALFETEAETDSATTAMTPANPLDELNTLIVEMVAAAQGEDQTRTWARRLSHILETLQALKLGAEKKKDSGNTIQDRLL